MIENVPVDPLRLFYLFMAIFFFQVTDSQGEQKATGLREIRSLIPDYL